MDWSRFSPEELERRRAISIEGMAQREREEFAVWYQEVCDREYWQHGQRCCGCDFWQSEGGRSGRCSAAGIVSGEQVLRSLGVIWTSAWGIEPPGFPYTRKSFWCGKFKDDFDWSTLPLDYQKRIGAFRDGRLRNKPHPPAQPPV